MTRTAAAAAEFDAAVQDAKAFERRELDRHRGLVEVWVGLFGVMLGAPLLAPQLDEGTSTLQYVLVVGFVLAYFAALFVAWIPFRFSFRWQGVWAKANSWHWGSLGGFLAAWFVLSQFIGLLSFLWIQSFIDEDMPIGSDLDSFKTRMAGMQLLVVGLGILFMNYWARDRKEILIGAGGIPLATLALAWPSALPYLLQFAAVAMFLPMLVLGLARLLFGGSKPPS